VRFEAGEFGVTEHIAVVPPPCPFSSPHRELFQLRSFLVADLVEPEEVSDVAELGPFPCIGFEAADLAATPAQPVAHLVGGEPGRLPQLPQPARESAFGDSSAVSNGHGLTSLGGMLPTLYSLLSCESQYEHGWPVGGT